MKTSESIGALRRANPRRRRGFEQTVESVTHSVAPVEVAGRGLVDVSIWRQQRSMTVHLVNLTNPMMMKGPLREAIPIGPLTVRIRLPEGARPSKVQLLTAGMQPRVQLAAGALTVTIPSVEIHEVIAVDL
jgi:hypothetical protein